MYPLQKGSDKSCKIYPLSLSLSLSTRIDCNNIHEDFGTRTKGGNLPGVLNEVVTLASCLDLELTPWIVTLNS